MFLMLCAISPTPLAGDVRYPLSCKRPHTLPAGEILMDLALFDLDETLIDDDSASLWIRWLVGQGATRNVANRTAMTDEEWIALWAAPDDEFFARLFAEPGAIQR